ncbi:hypothetical protein MGG_01243 [Paecilomyces variotii No. 5]|uniref:Mid2 domain-containing protein n=1 Tax=Byssochlamys spectabilis (strain No. 5 / NBRC 109023) TaxID=1356009 RepID=V5I573_BYSSN|nr:hypothetical protein MGG_01243 [Paecilomyces variotii No. 5]
MTFSVWYCWFLFFLPAYSDYYFINPPSISSNDPESPYYSASSGIVVARGEEFPIKWSVTDSDSRIVDLYLMDMDGFFGPQNINWTVDNEGNYDQYGEFYFLLTFAANSSATAAVSRSFNITMKSTTTSIPASTSLTTSSATQAIRTESSSSSTSSPSTTLSQSQSPGQISKGAKIGIGVAIPVAVIAGIAAGFLFARRSRGKPHEELRKQPLEHQNQTSYIAVPTAELPDTSPEVPYGSAELPSTSGVTPHRSIEMPVSTPDKHFS